MKKVFYIFTKNRSIVDWCSDFFILNAKNPNIKDAQFFDFDDVFTYEKFKEANLEGIELKENDYVNILNEFLSAKETRPICEFGNSFRALKLMEQVKKASMTDCPVLILGESGSGKSFVARKIHELSSRSKNVFFNVNMASISQGLAESELFGVEEGAFTDSKERKGYFLSSDSGTLFMDEIGDLKFGLQAKLLTFIESKKFRQVGSDKEIVSNTRLIFATNSNLEKKIIQGTFRKDLYYRMAAFVIKVPPLRERKEDILFLAESRLSKSSKKLSKSALDLLETHNWPGNIRQLFSCLDRAVLNCEGQTIALKDIDLG